MKAVDPYVTPSCVDHNWKSNKSFSIVIFLCYLGMSFWFLLYSVLLAKLVSIAYDAVDINDYFEITLKILQASFAILFLGAVFWGTYKRKYWARYGLMVFLFICSLYSVFNIYENFITPPIIKDAYSITFDNETQISGAKFTAYATPYMTLIVQLSIIALLVFNERLKSQFIKVN